MGIMAGEAIGRRERLPLVGLHQICVLNIMTVDAERGRVFGQMEIKFALASLTRLMRDVASVASHVERGVATTLFRNVETLRVAGKAKIVFLLARGRLQQLILVVRSMRIMTGQAITNRRRVDASLNLRSIFVLVAGQADFVGDDGDELHAGNISINPDFMAAQTAHRNGGVDKLTLRLILMAFEALSSVNVLI